MQNQKLYFDISIFRDEDTEPILEFYDLEKDCIKIKKLIFDDKTDTRYICTVSADVYKIEVLDSGEEKETFVRTELKQVVFDIEKDDWNIEGHLNYSNDTYGKVSECGIQDFFEKE